MSLTVKMLHNLLSGYNGNQYYIHTILKQNGQMWKNITSGSLNSIQNRVELLLLDEKVLMKMIFDHFSPNYHN